MPIWTARFGIWYCAPDGFVEVDACLRGGFVWIVRLACLVTGR